MNTQIKNENTLVLESQTACGNRLLQALAETFKHGGSVVVITGGGQCPKITGYEAPKLSEYTPKMAPITHKLTQRRSMLCLV